MSYGTYTSTYTVVDIKKTFEGFESDLRMIARRTGKWTPEYVERICHDVIKLAEAKYLNTVSIALLNSVDEPIRAVKFTVNESGSSISGDRAGGNDWPDLAYTRLTVILHYNNAWHLLSSFQQLQFEKENLKISWSTTSIDNSFPRLNKQSAQTYASNGYELKKDNYK
jgi:hypothetical protein